MNSRPTESGNQSFHLSRIHDTKIDLISGEVVLEIELELFHDDQKIFLGLMNTHRVNETSMSLHSGVAVTINTKNGELRDPINDQSSIGNINQNSTTNKYCECAFVNCIFFTAINNIHQPQCLIL